MKQLTIKFIFYAKESKETIDIATLIRCFLVDEVHHNKNTYRVCMQNSFTRSEIDNIIQRLMKIITNKYNCHVNVFYDNHVIAMESFDAYNPIMKEVTVYLSYKIT